MDKTAPHKIVSDWVELSATAIEALATVLIVTYIFLGTGRFLITRFRSHGTDRAAFEAFRSRIARALLLGLEILVAADIVRTVTAEVTLRSVAGLGLLVLVRTFLSWSVAVELDGRWPWQARSGPAEQNAPRS